jgi:hypothetical protein
MCQHRLALDALSGQRHPVLVAVGGHDDHGLFHVDQEGIRLASTLLAHRVDGEARPLGDESRLALIA